MERRKFFSARDERPAYGAKPQSHATSSHRKALFLITRPDDRIGHGGGYRDWKLPREPTKKTLAQLNPDHFPPVRNSIGTMDLTILDKFGTNKPYRKGVKDQNPSVKPHRLRRRDQLL